VETDVTRLRALPWTVGRVAPELGMSENAVVLTKSRFLKRLREEPAGLID
jgi:hypothetical protein